MDFIKFLTLMLLSLEPSYGDKETWEARTERMTVIAKAIDDASSRSTCSDAYAIASCEKKWRGSKKDLAFLLVTKGYWESRFAKNVHEGKCKAQECDAIMINGVLTHKARSPWQIQRTPLVSKDEYSQMNSATIESSIISANVATRYLVIGLNTCHTIKGAIAKYGGADCGWSGADHRYAFFRMLSGKKEADLTKDAENRKIALEKRLANLSTIKDK